MKILCMKMYKCISLSIHLHIEIHEWMVTQSSYLRVEDILGDFLLPPYTFFKIVYAKHIF